MEANTFATSAFIAAPPETVYDYLRRLETLDEWTLGSRMIERVDDSTWIGTASGHQRTLYYHVRPLSSSRFSGSVAMRLRIPGLFQVVSGAPVPARLYRPGRRRGGDVSALGQRDRSGPAHADDHARHPDDARLRGPRAGGCARAGNRAVGSRARLVPARGGDTIYIDAPLEMATEFVGDLRTMAGWSHLLRPHGTIERERGTFLDEYRQTVDVSFRTNRLEDYVLIEQDYRHPEFGTIQRSPTLLIPLAHAFGDSAVPGVLLHRITFWNDASPIRHGKLGIEDFGAENMNIKRMLEAKAGNLASFARGRSYIFDPHVSPVGVA